MVAKAKSPKIKETDLFPPVRDYLEKNGYTVRSEVRNCDIVAVKDSDVIVVELKTGMNVSLLIQATDRQRITDSVYVAIPDPPGRKGAHWRGIKRVLRQLELGLILVTFSPRRTIVSVAFDPLPYRRTKRSKRRGAVIQEVADRSADYNTGGSTRTPLVTAYRENAIYIACCLAEMGPSSPKALRAVGAGAKTTSILSSNFYGWFQRVARACYQVTESGRAETARFPEIHAQALDALKSCDGST
ncbi:MAG: hypothetical protein CMQ24_07085 [Gammaproteobacteria bacterium]|nr:hypothetical protein [Gammaproteobacteria bacterium]